MLFFSNDKIQQEVSKVMVKMTMREAQTAIQEGATHTTNINSLHTLFLNREISVIIQGVIPPVNKLSQMWLQQVEGICIQYVRFSIRKSSRAQHAALRVFSKILR